MKVLLVNGSPNEKGCTYTALNGVEQALNNAGITTEWFWIGKQPVRGCIGCAACKKTGRCVFSDDKANELLDAMLAADGFVVGSPVYFAGPNGALCALLDRVFYAESRRFSGKVAGAVVSARRAGTTAALDRLNKYLHYSQLAIATSKYWPMVHGISPADVLQDVEGMQVMHELGANMARLLQASKDTPPVENIPSVWTNFIR